MSDENETQASEESTETKETATVETKGETTTEPSAEVKSWRDTLPDDLRKTADRFNSEADMVRAIVDLRKRESQVRVPGKDASEDEISAYHKAIGVPESADKYEFPTVEGMTVTPEIEASQKQWAQRFHDLKVPADLAKKLTEYVNQDTIEIQKAQIEADKAYVEASEDALRQEWKGDFDKNKIIAGQAFTELANRTGLSTDNLNKIEMKDGRFLMDHPDMLKIFATIGREMSEGSLGPTATEAELETMQEQLTSLRNQQAAAQSEGNSKKANQLYQKEQALLEKMGNAQPVVGAQGRAA